MTEAAQPVKVTGPSVLTGVVFPPGSQVVLRIYDSNATTALDGDLVAALFALGLQTREPDRSGWVILGEIEVDDEISFLVGTTGIDRDTATEAVRRGVERALDEGVARRRDARHSATDRNEEP